MPLNLYLNYNFAINHCKEFLSISDILDFSIRERKTQQVMVFDRPKFETFWPAHNLKGLNRENHKIKNNKNKLEWKHSTYYKLVKLHCLVITCSSSLAFCACLSAKSSLALATRSSRVRADRSLGRSLVMVSFANCWRGSISESLSSLEQAIKVLAN